MHRDEERMIESRVFVELASYVEKAVESGITLFKLSELHSLYVNRLKDFGILKAVNKTRLKDLLLKHFPGVQEQCDGKNNTIIIFNKAMQNTYVKRRAKEKGFFRGCCYLG